MKYNGGVPEPNAFFIPEIEEEALADIFYGICQDRRPADLEFELNAVGDRMGGMFIPIGHDPGGNGLLLGVAGRFSRKVYYWDSCLGFEESTEDNNTFWLADSFSDFLGNLYSL